MKTAFHLTVTETHLVHDDREARILEALRLNLVAGVGPRIRQQLLEAFGSADAVMSASEDQLRQVSGVGTKLARNVLAARDAGPAEDELRLCRQLGVDPVLRDDPDYPPMLAEICDPPDVLYRRGELEERDGMAVAIVGSRRCTIYGRQQAERIAGGLARAGLTIVSGLARGIDACAHRGALEAGGRTMAVFATGLANVYPPEHRDLADQVTAAGAIVSEAPLRQAPTPGLFPQRNRIISGLSLGVILIEAGRKSGALHTARHAMEQGREVFAVPGRIDSLESEGCHNLIRDGVALCRGIDDVLEGLGPLVRPVADSESTGEVQSARELTLNDQERAVLNLVGMDPRHMDEVLRDTAIEPSRVMATVTILEMKRMIRRLPGGYVVRRTG